MHPFPSADALQFLIGDSIAQVWLDPYSLQFRFESSRHLFVGHRIEHAEPDGTVWTYDCQDTERGPLVLQRLLYCPIVTVEREDLRLTLRMKDGQSLTVLSDLGPYEAGYIDAPEIGLTAF